MVARSANRSKQRPDTLMQDRTPPDRRNPLATHGRTIHWVMIRNAHREHIESASPPTADISLRRGEPPLWGSSQVDEVLTKSLQFAVFRARITADASSRQMPS